MYRIQIIGQSLVVTDTITNAVLFDKPKSSVYYDKSKLNNGKVLITRIYSDILSEDKFEAKISQCVDVNNVTFTIATFRLFCQGNLGGSSGNGASADRVKYRATNYTDLLTKSTDNLVVGDLAYVTSKQGTGWLPGDLGGTYYPSGWYVWNGVAWVSENTTVGNFPDVQTVSVNNFPATQPISGSVKITDGAGEVTTKQLGTQVTTNDVGLVTNTVIHGKTTAGGNTFVDVKVTPSGALAVESEISNFPTNQLVSYESKFYDGGGRLRVSEITELGEYKILNSNANSESLASVGTATFSFPQPNQWNMAVTSGQYGIIYSKKYHPYLNGKAQLIELTTTNFGTATDVEKSIGYISSDATGTYNTGLDGFRLFKSTANVYAIEIWRGGTRTINHTQSLWTLDKLDGTGASGYNMLTDNFQFFAFDFLYLGGTAIRAFAFINGSLIHFTTIPWAGSVNVDGRPIFNSPNKPIRYEIRSTTGSDNMDFVCALVASEGQQDIKDQQRVVKGSTAGVTYASGTTYAVCGVRKLTTQRDIHAYIKKIEGVISSNTQASNVEYDLRLNPTVAGTFAYSAVTGTPYEQAIGAVTNTVTGGTILNSTYASAGSKAPLDVTSVSAELNGTLANTMDELVLCATPILGGNNILGTGSMVVGWLNA